MREQNKRWSSARVLAARKRRVERRKKADALVSAKFAPILAQLCKPQLGAIRLEWLIAGGFTCVSAVILLVLLAMVSHMREQERRIQCSNGYVWTEWCGCQPPVYGDDC